MPSSIAAPIAPTTPSHKLEDTTPQTIYNITSQTTPKASSIQKHDRSQIADNIFIPEGLTLPDVCARADSRIQRFLDEQIHDKRLQTVQAQVRKSLGIIEEALERYSLSELSLSYNGGKDCLVLLILYLSAIHRKGVLRRPPQSQSQSRVHVHLHQHDSQKHTPPSSSSATNTPASAQASTSTSASSSTTTSTSTSTSPPAYTTFATSTMPELSTNIPTNSENSKDTNPVNNSFPTHLQSVYIQATHPFPAVEHFVSTTSAIYNLHLSRLRPPMRSGFAAYLASHRTVSAIFVGTRRTDPHGANLQPFQRTDHGWPDFVRIHPVLDWRYGEIWAFIRHIHIPYCPLYDAGYTSLGGTNDTHPNPALRLQHEAASSLPQSHAVHNTKIVNANATYSSIGNSSINENSSAVASTKSNGASHNDVDATTLTNTVIATSTTPIYKPAYELQDDELERLGRDR